MKSFSKSNFSNAQLPAWNVSDLDIESNVFPGEDQSERILALFGTAQDSSSNRRRDGSHPALHPQGTDLSLTSWQPGEGGWQLESNEIEPWSFVEASSDFFKVPEQQVWKDKFDAEKERVELVKQARVKAEEILHAGRAEAREILQAARAEAEEILQAAQDEIQQAKKNGYQQGWNESSKEIQGALGAMHAMVEEAGQWRIALMQEGEQILVNMLKEMAQTMFGEGVHLDADALQMNLNRIMEHTQHLGNLHIYLNPRDANLLDPSWNSYQSLITGNNVRIIPSEKIKPGGCIVKGSTGMVDARVETQLAAVLNTIGEIEEATT